MITFKILGNPTAKQSFRFAVRPGKEGKNFVSKYQPKKVVESERSMSWDIKSQLPTGFVPLDCGLEVTVLFVFQPPKCSKQKMAQLEAGTVFYKDTKPDLDNLEKALWDCMAGLVYVNDSRIVKKSVVKVYGLVPRTEISVSEIQPAKPLIATAVPAEIQFEMPAAEQRIQSKSTLPPTVTCDICDGSGWSGLKTCNSCGGMGVIPIVL